MYKRQLQALFYTLNERVLTYLRARRRSQAHSTKRHAVTYNTQGAFLLARVRNGPCAKLAGLRDWNARGFRLVYTGSHGEVPYSCLGRRLVLDRCCVHNSLGGPVIAPSSEPTRRCCVVSGRPPKDVPGTLPCTPTPAIAVHTSAVSAPPASHPLVASGLCIVARFLRPPKRS